MIALLKACVQRQFILGSNTILTVHRLLSNKLLSRSLSDISSDSEPELEVKIPDPPTTCCMSGCANCVWIEYAKELVDIYKDGGVAADKVMKAIDDPSLKIFLSLELKEVLKNTN